jgi:hypothetical protein
MCEALSVGFVNPSFEGNYFGWTVWATNATGTTGTWGIATNAQVIAAGGSVYDYYTKTTIAEDSPGLPITYHATDGNLVALCLQTGPEQHRIYQTVRVPSAATSLAWDMNYNNHAGTFDPTNQYMALNIRNPSTDAIIATAYMTTQGVDPQVVATMTTYTVPIAAYQNQVIRVDVDLVVNNDWLDMAFDNFRFQ